MSIIELLSDEHVAKLETVALRDATEWQGGGYRLSVLRYADAPDFTSGQGAYLNGSRYSPVGTFPVLYLGDDLVTASYEVQHYLDKFRITVNDFKPQLVATVAVSVGRMLDMNSSEILAKLGLTVADLTEEWEPYMDRGAVAPTQLLGSALHSLGIEAILVPSARHTGGVNIVVFLDNLTSTSHALKIDPS